MISGIDVSHWQGAIRWNDVARGGSRFAFMKATEGATWQDEKFAINRDGAQAAGIAVGAYHYLRATSSVPEQLENFVRVVGTRRAGELPPALDVEDPKQWAGIARVDLTELVVAWLQGAERVFGVKPLVYLSPAFAEQMLDGANSELGQYPLWIAHWGVNEPRVPKPWARWTFWQHSSTGSVDGIEGNVDLDSFFGEDLMIYAKE